MLDKKRVIELTEETVDIIIPEGTNRSRACFYYTLALYMTLKSLYPKLRVYVQAGSASFQAVPEEKDDGVSPTHYSYVYSGEMTPGIPLPEVHCWICIVDEDEVGWLVDPTVRYLPELCKNLGINWETPTPPNFLWEEVGRIPLGYHYHPIPEACEFIAGLIRSLLRSTSLELASKSN